MKAFEWIDRVKNARGIESDYAVAKLLGVTKSTISQYRSRGSTLDENAAITVAKTLGVEPAAVVLDQAAERVKSPEVRAALQAIAGQHCILCLITNLAKFAIKAIARRTAPKKFPLLTDQSKYALVA